MYIISDIFQLKFGHYRDAKKLLDQALSKGMMPETKSSRILSDFTGDSYRLVFEETYDTLAAYEKSLTESMGKDEWQDWYKTFREHVVSSHREILKEIK